MTDAIYHRVENGETPLVASFKWFKKRITFAIISTTLSFTRCFFTFNFY